MVMTPLDAQLMAVDAIARHLHGGGAALMPTDTLPALACSPPSAAQIWTLKQRPQDKPLILMAAEVSDLLDLTTDSARVDALPLVDRYWPGPLTLVLPAEGALTHHLNPGQDTLGMRIPRLCLDPISPGQERPLGHNECQPIRCNSQLQR
jgi:Putative translation factor (SUA5)